MARRQELFTPQPSYEQPPPVAPAEPAYAVELAKLADLKTQGLITEAEYEAKKKQILGI